MERAIFTGTSKFNRQEISCHVVNADGNEKTGPGYQTFIMVSDQHPKTAIDNGADSAVCGNCPFRKNPETGQRGCYVTLMGLGQTYKNKKKAVNPNPSDLTKLGYIRLGSYGDPAMLPYSLMSSLAKRGHKHSGYTHQWKEKFYDKRFDGIIMRSVETVADAKRCREEGARYYRVDLEGVGVQEGEIMCPYTRGITCAKCGLCNGIGENGERKNLKNIVIDPHGTAWQGGENTEKLKRTMLQVIQ